MLSVKEMGDRANDITFFCLHTLPYAEDFLPRHHLTYALSYAVSAEARAMEYKYTQDHLKKVTAEICRDWLSHAEDLLIRGMLE